MNNEATYNNKKITIRDLLLTSEINKRSRTGPGTTKR